MLFRERKAKGLIDRFLAIKRPNTQRAYRSLLRQFGEYTRCSPINALLKADYHTTLRYIEYLQQDHADNTVLHRINLLRALFSILQECGLRSDNPAKQLARFMPRQHREQVRPTQLIDFKLVKELLEAPPANTKSGVVDRAMLAIFFFGGLRRSEVVNLKLSDVITKDEQLCLIIHGAKSGEERTQVLNTTIAERVTALVAQRKGEGAEAESKLFVRYDCYGYASNGVSDYWIYRRYKHYTGAAPHSARSTAATQLLADGVEKRFVQAFLGHKGGSQVDTYDKRRVAVTNHPGKRLKY